MLAKKPKLIVMLSRFPFPLEKGDKLRAYFQIIELSKKYDITLLALSEKAVSVNDRNELNKFCSTVHVFTLPKWKSLFYSLFALFGTKPLQVGYFHSPFIHQKVKKIIDAKQPDHIYCQLVRTAEYVKNYHNCPKTIDYMDAFSKGIERRIELQTPLTRWLFRIESNRLAKYEREIYDYFEVHTIISGQDAQFLGTHSNQEVLIVPNGIAESFLNYSSDKEPEFDLVFVGNLSYPPNVQAVKFILNKILPLATKKGFNWRFLAAGAQPTRELISLIKNTKNAELLANTKDIREGYVAGKVFVAPMIIGTGLQNKLLEAMALGIPCVTTELANKALHAEPGNQICIATTAEEYIQEISTLLIADQAKKMGLAGKVWIESHFSWLNSSELLMNAMNKA